MKKNLICALLLALAFADRASAANASPSIVTSIVTATPAGAMIAAPSAGLFTVLNGCVFSNAAASGACVTLSSSVSGEPSLELCAPSYSTVVVGQSGEIVPAFGRPISSLSSLFGVQLAYSGSLTVTGSATGAGLLTCGYRTTNSTGN